jgi:hypothetical protein
VCADENSLMQEQERLGLDSVSRLIVFADFGWLLSRLEIQEAIYSQVSSKKNDPTSPSSGDR